MINKKNFHIQKIKNDILQLKDKKYIIGFTNGCFDLLHKGHIKLLVESKKKCDYLIVGLNSDSSIKNLKGSDRPIDDQTKRISNLSNIEVVNAIILFSEENPLELIMQIKPDILFKGADYEKKNIIGREFIEVNGGKVELIDILNGYSTTNIIKNSRIKN
jgi:D-beta-D-heptose 7-phosphate kinase/D-beta-D-heptose 1-phosphate adenosyltransferase|tara:strand:- start:230 stop:709 length:480 start_codon:yes stop_codon:yes gene_type:complete